MTGQFAQERQELFTTVRYKFPITAVIPCAPLLLTLPTHIPCATAGAIGIISDTQFRKMAVGMGVLTCMIIHILDGWIYGLVFE